MLRHLQNQLNGKSDTLPATTYARPSSTILRSPIHNKKSGISGSSSNGGSTPSTPLTTYRDGSARGIDTTPQIQKTWQRTSVPVRVTYIALVTSVVLIWYGWRWIRYSSGGIQIDCHSISCEIKVRPLGWSQHVHITDVARHQLIQVYPIHTTRDGTFVAAVNSTVLFDYASSYNNPKSGKKKNQSYKLNSSYKGPNENGHYLSYAIVFADQQNKDDRQPPAQQHQGTEEEQERMMMNTMIPDADLQRLLPYMEKEEDNDNGGTTDPNIQQQQHRNNQYYRLIVRTLGIQSSKRRVRTMIQKIESYILQRRQKFVLRESAPPSWQGIVCMVLGCMTLLITLALGQFMDDTADRYHRQKHRGPGVRRQQQQQQSSSGQQRKNATGTSSSYYNTTANSNNKKRDVVQEAYQAAIPSQYEVSTSSSHTTATTNNNTSTTTSYRRTNVPTRKK